MSSTDGGRGCCVFGGDESRLLRRFPPVSAILLLLKGRAVTPGRFSLPPTLSLLSCLMVGWVLCWGLAAAGVVAVKRRGLSLLSCLMVEWVLRWGFSGRGGCRC